MRQSVPRLLMGLGAALAAGMLAVGTPGHAAARPSSPAVNIARAPAAGYSPPRGPLYPGMHGAAVKTLQRRLAQLKYYPGRIDGHFGSATLEAVWAFKEVQGISTSRNSDVVGHVMERDLAHPRPPTVLVPRGGRNLRIEVNKKAEVLVLYRRNKVELISHVSTGGGYYYPCPGGGGTCGPAITPDGSYRAELFLPGWVRVPLGEMFNPVFFIGRAYAIHGDTAVPLQPVSHGCVRIPMDIAAFFHTLVHVSAAGGTPVYIRG